ncbi:MAG: TRAP transporter large permease [Thermodesulfobacteriota bacterium]
MDTFFIYLGLGLMVILFLTGAPLAVAFSLGAGIIAFWVMGLPLANFGQIFFAAIHSYPLLACPFFILAGTLILRSGGMEPLRDFMQCMVGHWRGGLAVATIVFAAFLGSISGSSAACLAILGTILVPILVQAGYDRPFASGMAVTSAELGLLIPPSLFFILFGAMNQISIADLFMSGVGPGLLCAFLMCLVAVFLARRRNYPTVPKASWAERWRATVRVFPVLLMPVIVLGGIYGGFFSPTQAAAVSVFYSIIVGVLVYRVLTWPGIMTSLVETVKISSMIYLMIIGGDLLSKILAYLEIPQMIAESVVALNLGPLSFLLVVELLLLVMGFFFSSIPMVIIVLPLFLPSVNQLGIDPVFYGALMVLDALIGEITPPMGPQLWIAAPICKEKMGAIIREAWPFLGAMTAALLLTTFFPGIALFLVNIFR